MFCGFFNISISAIWNLNVLIYVHSFLIFLGYLGITVYAAAYLYCCICLNNLHAAITDNILNSFYVIGWFQNDSAIFIEAIGGSCKMIKVQESLSYKGQ